MKKKFKFAGLKIKLSWKNSRFIKRLSKCFQRSGYTLKPEIKVNPEELRKEKIYRLFKSQYCEFHRGDRYGIYREIPTSMIYYKGCNDLKCDRYLIGQLLAGQSINNFFKEKGILIKEDIFCYKIVQEDVVLASFNKEWVERQGQYQ